MNVGSLSGMHIVSNSIGKPSNHLKTRHIIPPPGSSLSHEAQAQLSKAAELKKDCLSLTSDKSENIKTMMETLSNIQNRSKELRQFGDNLSKIRRSNLNIVKLGESLEAISHQLEYVTRILEQEQSGTKDKQLEKKTNNHIYFLKSLKERLDTYDTHSPIGLEAMTQEAKDLADSLKDIEEFLKRKIQERYNSLANSLDQSMGTFSDFSPNQAKELAIIAAGQLLKGFDLTLGFNTPRQNLRVVKLLRDDSAPN